MNRLQGKRIAVIATNGFEEDELLVPLRALEQEGANVDIISLTDDPIRGWKNDDWGSEIDVQLAIGDADADDYDGLLIPGGVMSPDTLRQHDEVVHFISNFFDFRKPVAAICHGPQLLIEADVIAGREMTSYQSIRTDLENAGALWRDESVVVDQGLVTSRTPQDLPVFCAKMIEEFREGRHADHFVA